MKRLRISEFSCAGAVCASLFIYLVSSPIVQASAPLERGDRLAYRLEADFEGEACLGTREDYFSRQLVLEPTGGGKYALHFHGVQPEMVGMPPWVETERKGETLRAKVEQRYTSHSLGWILIDAQYELRLKDDGDELEGTVELKVDWEPITEKQKAEGAKHASARKLPCRVRAKLSGDRDRLQPEELQREIAVWDLMKAHMDFLTARETGKAMAPLERALALEGDHHVEVWWRISRLHFLLGERKDKKDKAGRLIAFEKGIEAANKALQLDPDRGEASFFLAVNLGRKNTTEGFLTQAFGLEDFEANCLKAIRDEAATEMMGFKVMGDAHFAMGTFYRLVPDSWLVEMVLGTRGDIDKAIEHFRKAIALHPIRGDYMKGLGISLVCKGGEEEEEETIAEGMGWLAKSLETPIWAVRPEQEYEHVRRLMANPEDACGYSRDQY